MVNLIKKYRELILYGIFGVLTTIVNILVYYICSNLLHIHYLISTIIAWVISVLFAYTTNRKFVFESKNKNIVKEIISFFSFRILSGIIDVAIMYIFVDIFKWDDLIVKILSNVVVIILNYIFSKLFIFKKESSN